MKITMKKVKKVKIGGYSMLRCTEKKKIYYEWDVFSYPMANSDAKKIGATIEPIRTLEHAYGNHSFYRTTGRVATLTLSQARQLADIVKKENKKEKEKLAKRNSQVTSLLASSAGIAAAIYAAKKEAKKMRDQQEQIAERIYNNEDNDYNEDDEPRHYRKNGTTSQHEALHRRKDEKEEWYDLADRALDQLVEATNTPILGFHIFQKSKRDYVEIEGYCFHSDKHTSEVCLGEIDDHISAKKVKNHIAPSVAWKVLTDYIS